MKKVNYKDVRGECPEDCRKLSFKPLIADKSGAPNFYMRLFEIAPGGNTPKHYHEWEHEVFVVRGEGELVLEGREEKLVEGDAIYVESMELHQFVNSSKSELILICVIPRPKRD